MSGALGGHLPTAKGTLIVSSVLRPTRQRPALLWSRAGALYAPSSMTQLSKEDAQRRAAQLYTDLTRIAQRDPEQEVRGIALPVLDACITALRDVARDDPVISRMPDPYSVESIAAGEPVRAVDALVVLGQIIAVIGRVPPFIA
jgi:hypothetical protein